jgi:DNA replication protein DnaC
MTTAIETGALDKALRTLKLSGMPGTIDARLAQARAGELGHIEFLQVLCEDEITRRQATAITRRMHRARFEDQATLEGFDFTASPKLPAAQIRDLAALRWLHAGESVILYGPVGVGKSHIAQALGHLAVRHGADARFLKTSRALAHLAGGHADHTWHKRLAELTRPAVLILDDFAMRELTAAQADDLYELISDRAGKSLVLTSNRAPQDWYPLFPNPVVAAVISTRCDGMVGQRGLPRRGQVSTTSCGYWPKSWSSLSAPSRKARRWRSPRSWLMS